MDIRTCEICGQQFIAGYGYSIAACWLVTGSAYVSAFMCENAPGGQHWGCTPAHAVQALEKCLADHMSLAVLDAKHTEAHTIRDGETTTTRPRYAEADAQWASALGENFHFVSLERGQKS